MRNPRPSGNRALMSAPQPVTLLTELPRNRPACTCLCVCNIEDNQNKIRRPDNVKSQYSSLNSGREQVWVASVLKQHAPLVSKFAHAIRIILNYTTFLSFTRKKSYNLITTKTHTNAYYDVHPHCHRVPEWLAKRHDMALVPKNKWIKTALVSAITYMDKWNLFHFLPSS